MTDTNDCPRCGHPEEDFDGFGFLSCSKCNHCTHDSFSGYEDQEITCDFCNKTKAQITESDGSEFAFIEKPERCPNTMELFSEK